MTDGRRQTTDVRRRTIDEKFEVKVFLAGEAAGGDAAVAEAAAVEIMLENIGQQRTLGNRERCLTLPRSYIKMDCFTGIHKPDASASKERMLKTDAYKAGFRVGRWVGC